LAQANQSSRTAHVNPAHQIQPGARDPEMARKMARAAVRKTPFHGKYGREHHYLCFVINQLVRLYDYSRISPAVIMR
jgi:hypothetical protein